MPPVCKKRRYNPPHTSTLQITGFTTLDQLSFLKSIDLQIYSLNVHLLQQKNLNTSKTVRCAYLLT